VALPTVSGIFSQVDNMDRDSYPLTEDISVVVID